MALAALLPAAAFAQSNVTLYGIADAGAGWKDSGASGKSSTMFVDSGIQSSSRFGIRGSEDLGGGLKAIFNLESGVKWDTGDTDAAGFWQRRAVVGLAGSWGEINLGRDFTPGYRAASSTDVMSMGLFGNWSTFTTGAGGVTVRAGNGIHYKGTFSGLTVRAAYAEGERAGPGVPGSTGDLYGVSAVYAGGPLIVQGYYQEVRDNGSHVAGKAVKQAGIGGGYRFGNFRVTLSYGLSDPDRALEAGMGYRKLQGVGLGGGIKVGTGEILAQVIRLERDTGPGSDPKATAFGLAYVHPLSKRTNLYATLGTVDNNRPGSFALRSGATTLKPVAAGDDPKSVAFGIRHRF